MMRFCDHLSSNGGHIVGRYESPNKWCKAATEGAKRSAKQSISFGDESDRADSFMLLTAWEKKMEDQLQAWSVRQPTDNHDDRYARSVRNRFVRADPSVGTHGDMSSRKVPRTSTAKHCSTPKQGGEEENFKSETPCSQQNAWNKFQANIKGQGLTPKQASELYKVNFQDGLPQRSEEAQDAAEDGIDDEGEDGDGDGDGDGGEGEERDGGKISNRVKFPRAPPEPLGMELEKEVQLAGSCPECKIKSSQIDMLKANLIGQKNMYERVKEGLSRYPWRL